METLFLMLLGAAATGGLVVLRRRFAAYYGTFDMKADDVPGTGTGTMTGSAVQMVYPSKLPDSAGGHVLSCVDWMYLTPDGTVMNRSQFRKFGFKVAELIATIRPKAI